jgi:hypothetical protein
MKKLFLLVLVTTLSVVTISAQLSVGVKAGFNASNITGLPDLSELTILDFLGIKTNSTNNYKPGVNAGIAVQYMFTKHFGLESGLYYTMIGATQKLNVPIGENYINLIFDYNPSYLQLPISVLYKFEVGPNLYLYPSAGVYLAYGLTGKVKGKIESDLPDEDIILHLDVDTDEVDFFSNEMNRFDAGIGLGLNLQYANFVIGLGGDLGLLKINKEDPGNYDNLKNINVKVSVGYFF